MDTPSHMRVCQVSRTYPRDVSPGSGSVVYNLAKHIPAEVLYITKRLPGRYVAPPASVRLRIFSYWEPRIPSSLGPVTSALNSLARAIGSLWFLARATPAIIKFRPHLIHIHSVLTVPFAVMAKTILKVPVTMTFHGTDFLWFRKSRLLQRIVNSSVDVVFCVSHEIADEMKHLISRPRVMTVPNGVDFGMFSDRHVERRGQVVAVGHLKWQKGYEYLLQAMRTVVEKRPGIELLIAGAGPLEQELRAQAQALGIGERVRLLGVIPQERVAELLCSSRVYVMSSVSEGFPRALLEAMACGTPVVVTDVGECGRVARGAGYVVPPRDAGALADAILRLAADDDLWASCSEQAVSRASQYGWSETARITAEVYRELLALAPASPSPRP